MPSVSPELSVDDSGNPETVELASRVDSVLPIVPVSVLSGISVEPMLDEPLSVTSVRDILNDKIKLLEMHMKTIVNLFALFQSLPSNSQLYHFL